MNRSTVSDAIFAALCFCAIDLVFQTVKALIMIAWAVVSTVAVIFYDTCRELARE